jgi:hypothetical protein
MTIPADRFLLNDDSTAWVVGESLDWWMTIDHPCDTCDGQTRYEGDGFVCSADCIDGRHTFPVEVECPNIECGDVRVGPCPKCGNRNAPRRRDTYRVSIVPGMVLPIVSKPSDLDVPCVTLLGAWRDRMVGMHWHKPHDEWEMPGTVITDLPSAAARSQYAVKLKVAA